MTRATRLIMFVLASAMAFGLILVAPVAPTGTNAAGNPTTLLGQEAETAAARGPVTLYCQSPTSIRRSDRLNWWDMKPCTSYHADSIKPYLGWGMTYYNVSNGVRYTARCYNPNNCPSVMVPPDGVRVVGVFRL